MRAFTGAMDLPSPVISVVTPCVIFEAARPSTSTKSSDWPSMSMKPGATTSPVTSTRVVAAARLRSPMATMRSPVMARSARTHGAPVPSTRRPPARTTS